MSLLDIAEVYAKTCHSDTNHKYDKFPYDYHLRRVYDYAWKYIHLVPEKDRDVILASCWTHDLIEDARQTYNNVKKACGKEVADITYALTNEKGKTREERANFKYYEGIRNTPGAVFVKMCDRLANVSYSKLNNSSMFKVYKKENTEFLFHLFINTYMPYAQQYITMIEELRELLK